jgi:hypothetical protein
MRRPLVMNCEDYGRRSSLVAYGWLFLLIEFAFVNFIYLLHSVSESVF